MTILCYSKGPFLYAAHLPLRHASGVNSLHEKKHSLPCTLWFLSVYWLSRWEGRTVFYCSEALRKTFKNPQPIIITCWNSQLDKRWTPLVSWEVNPIKAIVGISDTCFRLEIPGTVVLQNTARPKVNFHKLLRNASVFILNLAAKGLLLTNFALNPL